jgi:hypothetical protein
MNTQDIHHNFFVLFRFVLQSIPCSLSAVNKKKGKNYNKSRSQSQECLETQRTKPKSCLHIPQNEPFLVPSSSKPAAPPLIDSIDKP